MISNLSGRLACSLVNKKIIDETERELYEYGLFMLLSKIFLFAVVILFGLIANVLIQSLIFFIAFMFLRQYAGGYHAKTELRCQLSTSFLFALCIAVIKASQTVDMFIPLLVVLMLANSIVLMFSPLDTKEKPLTLKEERRYRVISFIILAIIDAAIALSVLLKFNFFTSALEMAVILESILLTIGKISQENQNKEIECL